MNLNFEKKTKIKRLIFDVDGTLKTNVNFFSAIENSLKLVNLFSEENHLNKEIKCKLPENFMKIFFNELKKIVPKKNEKLIESIKKLSNEFELVLLTNYFSES